LKGRETGNGGDWEWEREGEVRGRRGKGKRKERGEDEGRDSEQGWEVCFPDLGMMDTLGNSYTSI
jgi:hypothetical protein